MKNLFYFVFFIFSFNTWSVEVSLDEKLQTYVKDFQLRPVTPPSRRNPELFLLGRSLFFEKDLSGNKNISCADCHHPRTFSHDRLPLALGEGARGLETFPGGRFQFSGQIIGRNSPALFNLHKVNVLFWDGRVEYDSFFKTFKTPSPLPENFAPILRNALAAQALFPMVTHEEMRGKKGSNEIANAVSDEEAWNLLFQRILKNEVYQNHLLKVFPEEFKQGKISMAHLANAIAHFQEQAFFSGDTKFDRYLKGDLEALSFQEKKGMDLFFGKGKCGNCHKGELLSGFGFQNVGVPQIGPGKVNGDDYGRYAISGDKNKIYAFRVPPLRNVALSAPYMHNGSFKTLDEVVEHYDHVEWSLRNYQFINDYKNYMESLSGPLRYTDDQKLAMLSSKLPLKLNFTEEEEELLLEFIKYGLTEVRFLPLVK